ncbi:hypothetical protein Sjap_011938 [Stephania japonica]|uniref:Mitochondrial GTPase 1 n=1 Tax=Stephania japonica TaxID=461633 RepID=A0AAP0JC93_9MAGN
MATATTSARYLGLPLEKARVSNSLSTWYTPHMAAASRALLERIPLVDFVVEVRDARIPLSSGCEYMRNFPSSQHMVVLNKMDLANGSQSKEWLKYFQEKNCICYGINSHNKGNIHEIGSHPNIYILDTPGVLPPQILDDEVCSKLALTGAISDHLVGEYNLARYLLAIVNSSEEYKHWKMLMPKDDEICLVDKTQLSGRSESVLKRKKVFHTDHTQDHIVRDVRRTLFETISSFKGNLEVSSELDKLIEAQFVALSNPFHLSTEQEEKRRVLVAKKLLNLYRTGRLGRYTLDSIP